MRKSFVISLSITLLACLVLTSCNPAKPIIKAVKGAVKKVTSESATKSAGKVMKRIEKNNDEVLNIPAYIPGRIGSYYVRNQRKSDTAMIFDYEDAEAYYNKGIAYYSKEDYDRAISDLNEAIRLNPNDAEAYFYRGYVYYSKGDYDRAIADYESALQIDPDNTDARNNLEYLRDRLSRKAFTIEGKKYGRKALENLKKMEE